MTSRPALSPQPSRGNKTPRILPDSDYSVWWPEPPHGCNCVDAFCRGVLTGAAVVLVIFVTAIALKLL
ncbi:hypothetical protein VT84_30750 [Gemmata sp. SH-PL17]|uniref:hypothetical protein n=1 Tax=Gemmata sp. SH-PL17 TaxID=1630693 RepID=UPI00078B9763|nr:hypothetical protein [Gemmata sp. SH-PL17]AMV28813.1 hypothetical protein VT84_30750 [Gemmata sp. SH-PL17]